MKITEKEFNIATGEETITERDATPKEIAEAQRLQTEAAERQAEAEAKAATRQVILDRLGLTEEEARILLGGN
jgi:hypothetical protein